MAVDVRGLRCFLAVTSTRSISRAAEIMHLAQPALSLQIKHLEKDLGVALFTRTHKGVVPTIAGLRFETHAREILDRLNLACEDIRDLATEPAGRVVVGLPQSMAKLLTVPLVCEVIRRWPKVQLQVSEMSTGRIPGNVQTGHLDIGLTFQADASAGLLFEPIVQEDLVLVAPPGRFPAVDPRTGQPAKAVRFRDLARHPMILPAPEDGLRALIDGYLRTNGVEVQLLAEVNAISQLISLVSSGVGCTILSYASVRAEVIRGMLSAARLTHPNVSRSVYTCRSATAPLPVAASAVFGLLMDTVRTLIADGQWNARVGQGQGDA